jgi:RNA polymerase sigma-70 factor (ECF subfamily)
MVVEAFSTDDLMVEHPDEDLRLMRQIRRGDERAFALFYDDHQGKIFRFALHMTGNEAVAEDITQEVFMLLICKPRAYDPSKGSLISYLFGVARNLARRAVRSKSLDVCLDDADQSALIPAPDVGVDEMVSSSEVMDTLRRALLALPESYREVIVLCDLEEMTYAQASQITESNSGTIASRLHRAHNLLRTKLVLLRNTANSRK